MEDHKKLVRISTELREWHVLAVAARTLTQRRAINQHMPSLLNDNGLSGGLLEPFPDGWWASP